MKNKIIKNEKRRNFLQLSAIGGFFGFLAGFVPFKIAKADKSTVSEQNSNKISAKIKVKSHPLAINRNKQG